MEDIIQIWFLVASYTQVWPPENGRPHTQGGSEIYAVYQDEGQCLRAMRHFTIAPTVWTTVGTVRQIHITKRCAPSEAKLKW